MSKKVKYFLAGLLIIFVMIQFVPTEFPPNKEDLSTDLLHAEKIPEDVKLILEKACYDCHSEQPRYPWYAKVAPSSWLVAKDIREAREELNFSEWSELSKRKKIKSLKDAAEEVEKKNMPLKIYTVIHRDAILSDAEIKTITDWTKALSAEIIGE